VVLPEADGEGERYGERADHEAAAQLVEVVDDAQPIFVPNRAETNPRH
jgi:hypothetical protein